MKVFRASEEDELWAGYDKAYSAILNCLSKEFPSDGKSTWNFQRGYVTCRSNSYAVSASFTRYDKELQDIVMVGCSAEVKVDNDEVSTSCSRRVVVEFDPLRQEYITK